MLMFDQLKTDLSKNCMTLYLNNERLIGKHAPFFFFFSPWVGFVQHILKVACVLQSLFCYSYLLCLLQFTTNQFFLSVITQTVPLKKRQRWHLIVKFLKLA